MGIGLPVELIYEIVSWCIQLPGSPSLRALCLVSRQFQHIVQPILLQSIVLGGRMGRQAHMHSYSTEIGSLASLHACSLVVDLGGSFNSSAEHKLSPTEMVKRGDQIRPSIESCRKVQRTLWNVRDIHDEPPWVQYPVIDALRATKPKELIVTISEDAVTPSIGLLSDISRLSVDYRGSFPIARDALQYGLAKLLSESPKMSHLELVSRTCPIDLESVFSIVNYDLDDTSVCIPLEYLGIFGGTVMPIAFSIIAARHFGHLKSLALFNNVADSFDRGAPIRRLPNSEIWRTLKAQNIQLTSISTDSPLEGSFLEYLESLEGLRKFQIGVTDRSDGQKKGITGEELIGSLVDHHGRTLVEVNIMAQNPAGEWMWPFPEATLKKLATDCPNLADLGVTVDGVDVKAVRAAIDSLITYANSLPHLEQLTIYHAVQPDEDYRNFHYFEHYPTEKSKANDGPSWTPFNTEMALHNAISSYRSDGSSDYMYRLVVDGSTYSRRRDGDGFFSFKLL